MPVSVPESAAPTGPKGSITVASATAIGVGGMMGAGLYTLVGLASTTAGVWVPLAFLVGGAVSVFSPTNPVTMRLTITTATFSPMPMALADQSGGSHGSSAWR